MLTKCLAKALAPEVRVNAIAPGTITMSGDPSEWETDFIRRAPLHRAGTTEDVADAVSYLVHARIHHRPTPHPRGRRRLHTL